MRSFHAHEILPSRPTRRVHGRVAGGARRVTLGVGQEAGSTDLSLVPGRAATISGVAVDSQGRPFGRNVTLREEIRGVGFGRFGGNLSGAVAADGSFTIRHVPPGDYKLVATTGRDTDHPEAAIVPITVDGIDVIGVVMTGTAGGSIAGHILTDAGVVPTIPQMRVTIGLPLNGQADPTLLGTFGTPGSSAVAADGSFFLRGVFGRSRIRVALPDTWMVKAIMYEGRDITDAPIELQSAEVMSGVQIIVTDRVSVVAGQVTDVKGIPLADATILVFAENSGQWADDSRARRDLPVM